MQNQTEPTCFGKSWEANHPECAGGLDPAYTNLKDGSNRREKCGWYSACYARMTSPKGPDVQACQLVRPGMTVKFPNVPQAPAPAQAPPSPWQSAVRGVTAVATGLSNAMSAAAAHPSVQVRPPVQAAPQPAPQVQYQQPQQMQYYQQQQQGWAHPSIAAVPWAVPMNYPMPGAQIPAYLTVPEPVVDGQHWTQRLGFSILRSMMKATGHTVANFFDHNPITPWGKPPGM